MNVVSRVSSAHPDILRFMMLAAEQDTLPPIEPPSEPWEPNPIPSNIEVPGLDTSAPVQDQIEQIEQLITIRLQNIDANFARAHQILSTRILPAVKRYAVNTEPVREAARFWVSFYEQAAQVRIPTSDDISGEVVQQAAGSDEEAEAEVGVEQEQEQERTRENPIRSGVFDPNVTPSDSSFAPESAAVSSTPMVHLNERTAEQQEDQDMWARSVESPLKRLDKGLKSLGDEQDSVIDYTGQASSATQRSAVSGTSSIRGPVFTAPEKDKGKGKAGPSLYQNVLSKNTRGPEKEKSASPLKSRNKTPKKNPYVPPDIRRADWDGIVDLTKPKTPRGAKSRNPDWSSDEENFPPPDLSPPRSAFAKRIANIGRTPVREAAARIGRDLVDAERVQLKHQFNAVLDPSLSNTLSTPSLSRYSKRAMGMESSEKSSSSHAPSAASIASATEERPSIEEMMRHYGLKPQESYARPEDTRSPDSSFDSLDDTPGRPFPNLRALPDDGRLDDSGDFDSDDDSFGDSLAAQELMLASAQQGRMDDSFDNSDRSSDSLEADLSADIRVAQVDDSFDDSLDDDVGVAGNGEEDPTVFGTQADQRLGGQQLQLLGQGLVDDTTAMNPHMRGQTMPETPTPWTGAGQGE